jgi:hypothetical protein
MKTWNERLAYSMELAGVNPHTLSTRCGVGQSTVSAWLGAGKLKPSADIRATTMMQVCKVLDVRPEWLMLGTPPMRQSEEWPFSLVRLQFDNLPAIEKRRIDRFVGLTSELWEEGISTNTNTC